MRPLIEHRVFVIGLGQTKFSKPGRSDVDYPDMVKEAVTKALSDAQCSYKQVQAAAVGYLYGGSCSAQRALYEVDMTGIPIFNVNNACASGSSAIYLMKRFIETGKYDCALACGFEKMAKGSLEAMGQLTDRANPAEKYIEVMSDTYGLEPAPITAQMFGMAGREHMDKYGTKREHFAKIAWKNHKHSKSNPEAQNRTEYSMEQIMNSRKIYDFMTLLECSPTSDGAAAVIMCSESYLRERPHLQDQAVEILGMELGTDFPSSFNEKSNIKNMGFDIVRAVSTKLYKSTGIGPADVQVIECHDCFSPNELITYEALGLCPVGQAGALIDAGDNTYGGKWVINPSGGLIAKGHPIGATGVSQCIELCKHLRGIAGERQVPNARVALQHNIGIGSAGVVALYKLGYPKYPSNLPAAPQKALGAGGVVFKSDTVFNEIMQRAKTEGKELAGKVKTSFSIVITGGPDKATKTWLLDLKSDPFFIGEKVGKAECQVTVSDEDFLKLAERKLKPEQAFMQGKLKIKGNLAKAMKLKDLLENSQLQLNAKL